MGDFLTITPRQPWLLEGLPLRDVAALPMTVDFVLNPATDWMLTVLRTALVRIYDRNSVVIQSALMWLSGFRIRRAVTSPQFNTESRQHHTTRLNLHTKNVFEHITQSEVFRTGRVLPRLLQLNIEVSNFFDYERGIFYVQKQEVEEQGYYPSQHER